MGPYELFKHFPAIPPKPCKVTAKLDFKELDPYISKVIPYIEKTYYNSPVYLRFLKPKVEI